MASLLSSQSNFYNNIIQEENKIIMPLKCLYNNYMISLNINPNNFNNKENHIIPFNNNNYWILEVMNQNNINEQINENIISLESSNTIVDILITVIIESWI